MSSLEQIFLLTPPFNTTQLTSSPAPLKLHIQHYTNVIIIYYHIMMTMMSMTMYNGNQHTMTPGTGAKLCL